MSKKITVSDRVVTLLTKDSYVDDNIQLVLDEKLFPSGTVVITENGTHDVEKYTTAEINVDPRKPEQSKEVEYNENGQYVVSPEEGYVLTDVKVAVNVPIPEGYLKPEGNINITNTAEVDVTNYATAKVVDNNLTAENIAENVTVLGITGTFRGGIDTSDATATNDDLLLGKIAYANEQKLVGTIEDYDYSTSDEDVRPEIDRFLMNDFTEYYNDRITSIGTAFTGNLKITNISLPNVKDVGKRAFASCSSLVTVNLPNATSVGAEVFEGTGLEYISLPSLLDVASRVFYQATNLKTLHIPNAEIIRSQAFYKTYDIRNIIIEQDHEVCTLMANAFYQCYHILGTVNATYNPDGLKDGYIYVPDALVDSYKNATNWSVYAEQIKPLSELEVE